MKIIIILLIAFIFLSAYQEMYALRCGDHLIDVGDSKIKVLHNCGRPTILDTINNCVFMTKQHRCTNTNSTVIWTYNFGPNQFVYVITFANNKVISIETNGYGYDKH